MQRAAADRLIDSVLAVHASSGRIGPDAVTLLAREYAHSGRADVGDAIGLEVAGALENLAKGSSVPSTVSSWQPLPSEGRLDSQSERAAWLTLFVDMASLSDDARLTPAIATLSASVAAGWPGVTRVGAAMREVDACLRAGAATDPASIARVVDELERLIACAYEPGEGVRSGTTSSGPGLLASMVDDHAQAAHALLTAYSLTSRLPYAMLADDLMQFARRSWWADDVPTPATLEDVASLSVAARVLLRLAAVHAQTDYLDAAVVTEGYAHLEDAGRLLAASADAADRFGADACIHALAVGELRATDEE